MDFEPKFKLTTIICGNCKNQNKCRKDCEILSYLIDDWEQKMEEKEIQRRINLIGESIVETCKRQRGGFDLEE